MMKKDLPPDLTFTGSQTYRKALSSRWNRPPSELVWEKCKASHKIHSMHEYIMIGFVVVSPPDVRSLFRHRLYDQ